MTDTTNPADEAYEVDAEEVVDDQVSDQGEDGEESEDASQDDETEEVERNGKKYRIPKDLKDDLLRQDDYTRKTQEVAESRRALEAERVKMNETNEAVETAKFDLRGVQSRLADLQALTEQDWYAVRQMDARDGTNRYDALQREFLTLPHKEAEIKKTLDTKLGEVTQAQQEIIAKRVSEGQAVLARDIPGWGPELGAKLVDFVKSEYGIDEKRHGDAFMDPALVKMAHAAYAAKEASRKQAAQRQGQRVESLKPIPQARAGSGPIKGLDDRLSGEEWIKRREKQLARKG